MNSEGHGGFAFPVGYHRFHKNQLFNFQLNRPYSLGYARFEDLEEAGKKITTFTEWKTEMLRLAEEALSEDRLMNAAFYYRAVEFYTFPGDPDKQPLYDRFSELFYRAFEDHGIERVRIPYGANHLPAIIVDPEGTPRGNIILHGGYDSFIEEFYSLMRYFAASSFRIIGFDGPGQGAARRKSGLLLDFEWEKPVGAVLNHFGLEEVTLIGLSMGGYFALRTAAFEPRVKRVIASGHAYDYRKVAPAPATWLLMFFRNHLREFTNKLSRWKIRKGGMEAWNISHMMYVLGLDEPMAALDFAFSMNEENLHSDKVRQDVLILVSRQDHFIPFRLHKEQLRRLTSARSVADRVFMREEHAHNHCQIGNIGLALRVMEDWIDKKTTEQKSGEGSVDLPH
ncbi:MAG: alpha/beta fold hydrolase [Candidatus Latescibacteria bacterium]|nr:alpha/beta fold hydrolase [Candidatus Latescibacterota bacterium]NIO27157.1 alpha/beta fold hydrolase [Candidatus Latescibacterota bacterium]NIO54681.1 alpha/beta fold hydrolase [Candidatus Latescibacterota bacterium]NIT00764.1 alpha/beta fold hydrolase [Candidatus Latescibacterota bacterium]NIT37687.1 alpha/beta fold hydrolase [Candidatus Latescibacterota bacterium]